MKLARARLVDSPTFTIHTAIELCKFCPPWDHIPTLQNLQLPSFYRSIDAKRSTKTRVMRLVVTQSFAILIPTSDIVTDPCDHCRA